MIEPEITYYPEVSLADIERKWIRSALFHFKNKSKAARALGITTKTIYNKIHEYGWENELIRWDRDVE